MDLGLGWINVALELHEGNCWMELANDSFSAIHRQHRKKSNFTDGVLIFLNIFSVGYLELTSY